MCMDNVLKPAQRIKGVELVAIHSFDVIPFGYPEMSFTLVIRPSKGRIYAINCALEAQIRRHQTIPFIKIIKGTTLFWQY